MNIFVLSETPKIAAEYHCDKHVIKMILESAQMLSTAFSNNEEYENLIKNKKIYRKTHFNHPCAKWARECIENWNWLRDLSYWLNEEKKYRYNSGDHKSWIMIKNMSAPNLKENASTTPFQCCMPDYCKTSQDPIENYRNYYINEKQRILKYTKRHIPDWIYKNE